MSNSNNNNDISPVFDLSCLSDITKVTLLGEGAYGCVIEIPIPEKVKKDYPNIYPVKLEGV